MPATALDEPSLPLPVLQSMLDGLPFGACLLRGLQVQLANQRLADLLERPLAEVAGAPDLAAFSAPEDRQRTTERNQARLRGEQVPDEYQVTALLPSGERSLLRIRVSRFPAAGPGYTLAALTSEGARGRTTQLISGFADAAMAVQEARDIDGIFRTLGERLGALGLSVLAVETWSDPVGRLEATGALAWVAEELHRRWGGQVPLASVPLAQAVRQGPQGLLIDDLGSVLAQALKRPRAEVPLPEGLQGLAAAIAVDGAHAFTLVAAARDLELSVASAFGLFARELGFAIETTRRLAELARSNRELMTVNHVARASATLGSGRALRSALERLASAVPIDDLALFRHEEGELVLIEHLGFGESWVARATRLPVSAGAAWGEAVARKSPVVYAHAADGDAVAVPLRVSEEVQGVLVAARPGKRLSAGDLRLLSTVGAQLAINLQNAFLFQQTQARVGELQLLLELGQAVGGSLDQRQILAAGARVATQLLRCSAAYVFLPEGEDRLRCAAFEDALAPVGHGFDLPLERGSMTARAFLTGRPQASANTREDPRIDEELNALFGCRAVLAVPLLSNDKPLGVLLLVERNGEREFGQQDVRLAAHAAQLLAASVDKAALYAEQRQRAEEMTLLNEVSLSLAGTLEREPLLRNAAETLRKLLSATHCFVLLLDEREQVLSIHTAPAAGSGLASPPLRLDQPSAAASAVRERRSVQVTDSTSSPLAAGEPEAPRRTALAVPLIARDKLLGAVVLDDTRVGRVFSPAEVERTTAVAGQIAMALLSATLYEELRARLAELEQALVERGRLEAELVESERLAALGELSASIAHEVRNPLGVIFNALVSLRRLLKPEGNVGLLLKIVGEEADRLKAMVDDLLDYSRPLKPALQPVPLLPLVEGALSAARGRGPGAEASIPVPDSVEVDLHIPPDLTLRADSRLLRQALINLFLNSFQAMPKGGVLSISAERQAAPGRPLARVLVRDTGPGIAADLRPRIFQPFFTTKATGTGLGLAVVKRIVEGHGGRIAVAEAVDPVNGAETGAQFELWLPVEG